MMVSKAIIQSSNNYEELVTFPQFNSRQRSLEVIKRITQNLSTISLTFELKQLASKLKQETLSYPRRNLLDMTILKYLKYISW